MCESVNISSWFSYYNRREILVKVRATRMRREASFFQRPGIKKRMTKMLLKMLPAAITSMFMDGFSKFLFSLKAVVMQNVIVTVGFARGLFQSYKLSSTLDTYLHIGYTNYRYAKYLKL